MGQLCELLHKKQGEEGVVKKNKQTNRPNQQAMKIKTEKASQ